MNQLVESVTASLFREYLHRNKLQETLEAFDREVPRTTASISNRLELAKTLHILKLIKANKHREKPYASMSEIIVADLIMKSNGKGSDICIEEKQHSAEMNCDGLVIKGTFSLAKPDLHKEKSSTSNGKVVTKTPQNSGALPRDRSSSHMHMSLSKARMGRHQQASNLKSLNSPVVNEQQPPLSIVGSSQTNPSFKPTVSTTQTNPPFKPTVSTSQTNPQFKPNHRPPSRQRNSYQEFESLMESCEGNSQNNSDVIDHFPRNSNSDHAIDHFPRKSNPDDRFSRKNDDVFKSPRAGDCVEFLDIEDEIDELERMDLSSFNKKQKHLGRSVSLDDLTVKEAITIREIVFGNATGTSFNPEWEQQSFVFNDITNLEFGLVQHKGGPCGVLAVVQAMIIKQLIANGRPNLSPSNAERQKVLIKVLAHILWQAANYDGGNKQVYVCSDSGRSKFHSSLMYRNDGITEKIQVTKCATLAATENCIKEFLPQFQNTMGKGCILFIYSVILSRGVEAIRMDMDEPGSMLMANHGYCSQELVNLLLMGYAAQNVFNNIIDLDGKILKGAREPRDIGFLTLYEYYKVFEVGSYMKNPSAGIWVICSESHYSVLFSTSHGFDPRQVTELTYYDSLGNQRAPYNLTVYPDCGIDSADDDPPLELCIRTRWHNARIDWNGDEPLL